MRFSGLRWEREADAIAKALRPYLEEKTPPWLLKKMGIARWQNECVPLTPNPGTIAGHAFIFLYLEDQYTANRREGLDAILTFLRKRTGVLPDIRQGEKLGRILRSNPVDPNLVRDWFAEVYPD